MTATEARKIIQALAGGRCPKTGEQMPSNSPYQQPDVIHALFLAERALERAERSEKRGNKLPEKAGKAWDTSEEQQICEGFDAGKSVVELAKIHQRTHGAIQSRLERLEKSLPQPRRQF